MAFLSCCRPVVLSKSHALRMLRSGEDEYARMMLEVQSSLIGLEDWAQVITAEERSRVESLTDTDPTTTPEFLQAKGEDGTRVRQWRTY